MKHKIKNVDFEVFVKAADIKEVDGDLFIEGYASTESVDRSNELVLTSSARPAIEQAMKVYENNPVILYEHRPDRPCGRMVDWNIDEKGLFIKALISKAKDCEDVRTKINEKILKGFSIGFGKADVVWDEDSEVIIIKSLELYEISVVSIPCNRETLFDVVEKHFKIKSERKKTVDKVNKNIELTPEEYKSMIASQALYDQANAKAKNLEESVKNYKEEIEEMKKSGVANEETTKALEAKLAESQKQLDEMSTKLAEIESKSDITLSGGKSASTKDTKVVGFNEVVDKFKSLDGLNMNDIRQAFFAKKLKEPGVTGAFDFSDAQAIASYLNIDITSDENKKTVSRIATKAITSSNGVIKIDQVDYQPIEMDDSRTPLLAMTPMVPQDSKNYKYYKRTAKNTASFAAEGFTPTATSSTYAAVTDALKVMYSAGQVNDFAEAVAATPNNTTLEMQAMDRAMDEELHWNEIHGEEEADSNTFNGLMHNLRTSSSQVIDNGASVLTLDMFEDLIARFKSLMAKSSTDKKKPTAIMADTDLFAKFRKLLRADTNGLIQSNVVTIGGYRFENVLVYDGVPIVEVDDLRDWDQDAPTFAVAKAAGGSLADDEYFVVVSGVTANGETTGGTEASATTETTNNTVNITITQDSAVKYYKIYWGTATGVVKLIKVVANDGETSQVVAITSAPTQYYETPLAANEGILLAAKFGNMDGFEFGVNEMKRFVQLGKVGDYEKFYIRSYIRGVLKNPYAVVKMQVKKAS